MALLTARISSFALGFGIASAVALLQIRQDLLGSQQVLLDQVTWFFCCLLILTPPWGQRALGLLSPHVLACPAKRS